MRGGDVLKQSLDEARDERFARDALRCAKDKDELVSAWWAECDHFRGAARERLQEEYAMRLRDFGLVTLG